MKAFLFRHCSDLSFPAPDQIALSSGRSRKVQIKYRAWLKTSQTPIPHVLLFLPDYRTMKRRKIQSIGKKLENP
ncbi:hypothetical protein [Neglectibacter timonensis]|jgi:hypothetical protein|uniref:hypothetical protein n=1 Tax=Neglectibacter timonensis TaxID=1776382 RepID=UPI0039A2BD24